MLQAGLIIGGEKIAAAGGETFDRLGPEAAQIVTRASAAGPEDALRAVAAAGNAFQAWSETPGLERERLLGRVTTVLRARRNDLCAAAREELGATSTWIDFNIDVACRMLTESARLHAALGNHEAGPDPDGNLNILRREPVGVVLGIAPWNAPVTLAVRAVAAPIALGNTAILKGSELCPRTHELVASCFLDAGLPPGVVNFLTSAPETTEAVTERLIAHPAIRRVNFTGSTRVGRTVAELAARHLKRCVLELSGKAPAVICDDADLDQAARDVAFGAFMNAGQICMSTDRVILSNAIADAFVAKLRAETAHWAAERDADGAPMQGHLISAAAGQRLRALLVDAETWGAKVLAGGSVVGTEMAPTIVDHVSSAARLYREETFGPIVTILRVADEDEAVSVANDSPFGLTAAVYARSEDRALSIAERLESGICQINGPSVCDDPAMPFGGMKNSGYGRLGGQAAVEEFTELRWISLRRQRNGNTRSNGGGDPR